jgi:hypothetical protein
MHDTVRPLGAPVQTEDVSVPGFQASAANSDLEVLEELLVARWVDEYMIVVGRSVEGWRDT